MIRDVNRIHIATLAPALVVSSIVASCGQRSSEDPHAIVKVVDHAEKLADLPESLEKRIRSSSVAINIRYEGTTDEDNFVQTCSGTIVDTKHVLTARHCFEEITAFPSDVVVSKPVGQTVVFGVHAKDAPASHHRKGTTVTVQRKNEGRIVPAVSEVTTLFHDLALVRFEGGLPDGFEPAPLNAAKESPGKGTEMAIAGFGASKVVFETEVNPIFGSVTRTKQSGAGEWIRAGFVTMDGELETGSIGNGGLRALDVFEFLRGSTLASMACNGDSGGPVFGKNASGEWQLFAVINGGDADCQNFMYATDVRKARAWIDGVLRAAP